MGMINAQKLLSSFPNVSKRPHQGPWFGKVSSFGPVCGIGKRIASFDDSPVPCQQTTALPGRFLFGMVYQRVTDSRRQLQFFHLLFPPENPPA